MKILGIIPARSGSKGIPGKNIRPLLDRPLIHYTANSASRSSKLTKCIISTDSLAIADSISAFGIEVPFIRPGELAKDSTASIAVVEHALDFFQQINQHFDAICLLQPTSPFRLPGFIDTCIEHFVKTDADTLFSTVEVPHQYNPHWTFVANREGLLTNACGDKALIPQRQLLPPAFIRDGSIYIVKTACIREQHSFYGSKITHVPSPQEWYVNIDTEEDWHAAEKIAAKYLLQAGL